MLEYWVIFGYLRLLYLILLVFVIKYILYFVFNLSNGLIVCWSWYIVVLIKFLVIVMMFVFNWFVVLIVFLSIVFLIVGLICRFGRCIIVNLFNLGVRFLSGIVIFFMIGYLWLLYNVSIVNVLEIIKIVIIWDFVYCVFDVIDLNCILRMLSIYVEILKIIVVVVYIINSFK